MDDSERYSAGMQLRKEVLGHDHVSRATSGALPCEDDFQNFITRYAWGEIWTRPGLSRHVRSLLTIAMLTALGRDAELELHLRAAGNNGVTDQEIAEVLMHAAVYCGVPAANHAFMLARKVILRTDTVSDGGQPAHWP